MLPTGAGNFSANANNGAVRTTLISQPDETQPTGIKVIKPPFTGPTAKSYNLTTPCFRTL
jgi:hypothetical protein